jgi:ABC-type transport system substrate-binding protein
MLSNFASPWDCVYSAAKLKQDPRFPERNIMGTGPFTFVEHVAGSHWTGKKFDGYFEKGKPHLNGYVALFVAGAPMVNALAAGEIMAGNVLGKGYTAGVGMTIGTFFGRQAGTHAAKAAQGAGALA